jgi:hypothetical protein
MTGFVSRDEREAGIDLAADRVAYLVVSYGLLISAAVRSFVNGEEAWDLIGLVVLGGMVGLAYRLRQGVVSGRWTLLLAVTIAIAFVVGSLLVVTGR